MTDNPQVLNLIKLLSSEDTERQFQGAALLEALGRDFLKKASGGDLKRANFGFQAPLGGVDFSDCNLQGASFEGANLSNANFEGAFLDWANFELANLEEANFRHASLHEADMGETILVDADFTHADISGVNWYGSWGHPELPPQVFYPTEGE